MNRVLGGITSLLGQNKHINLSKLDNEADPYSTEPIVKKSNIPINKKHKGI